MNDNLINVIIYQIKDNLIKHSEDTHFYKFYIYNKKIFIYKDEIFKFHLNTSHFKKRDILNNEYRWLNYLQIIISSNFKL